MPKIKLIIFDWDDVFTRGSTKAYLDCYQVALQEVGVNLDDRTALTRMRKRWGSRHELILAELLAEQPKLLDKAGEIYKRELMGGRFEHMVKVVPEAPALLERLARNYKLGLVSGIHPELLLKRVMPRFGVPNKFSKIITAYDLEDPKNAKPHPYSAQSIMTSENISPGGTLVVGDAANDVIMGKNAGTHTVAVLGGHLNRRQAKKLKPDYIIEHVSLIESVLA